MTDADGSQSAEAKKNKSPPKLTRLTVIRVFGALKRYRRRMKRNSTKDENEHRRNESMMARWTRRVGLFTLALVFVGIVSAYILHGQLAVMQGQLDAMKADQRPWISIDEPTIADNLTYDPDGSPRVTVRFFLRNTGKSPAANVQVFPKFALVFGDPRPFQRELCDPQRHRPGAPGNLGITLFPNDTKTQFVKLPIARTDIDAFIKTRAADFGVAPDTSFLATLVGCVDYKFTFAEGHHQTGFIEDLRKIDPGNSQIALALDLKDGPLAADQIKLIQSVFSVPPD